jgi:hypothetical protein
MHEIVVVVVDEISIRQHTSNRIESAGTLRKNC